MRLPKDITVAIVGAGPAGLGCAIVLKELDVPGVVVFEREQIGASFAHWPEGMRLITPSFTSNGFGMLDMNAIALDTSPAYSLHTEHPTGKEYALYLQGLAAYFRLPVKTKVEVKTIETTTTGFNLHTSQGITHSQFVIWAAGEFQYPHLAPFPGAEYCQHNATISSWQEVQGEDVVIIGGYESGIDAAIHLARLGKQVRVLDIAAPWQRSGADPSLSLSPYTIDRLNEVGVEGSIRLTQAAVQKVEKVRDGYRVVMENGRRPWITQFPPILATGFVGSHHLINHLFDYRSDGYPMLTAQDESTLSSGLFLAGPSVRHEQIIFCFIYKFRQRFAVIADVIAERLGLDRAVLSRYRQKQMFLDDLSCCDESCAC